MAFEVYNPRAARKTILLEKARFTKAGIVRIGWARLAEVGVKAGDDITILVDKDTCRLAFRQAAPDEPKVTLKSRKDSVASCVIHVNGALKELGITLDQVCAANDHDIVVHYERGATKVDSAVDGRRNTRQVPAPKMLIINLLGVKDANLVGPKPGETYVPKSKTKGA